MRIIDADALKEQVESHVVSMSVCLSMDEHYGKVTMREDCLQDIDAAPTVPAIPVEWIEWRIAHAEREGFGATVSMLRTVRDWWNDQRDVWEREQEAR